MVDGNYGGATQIYGEIRLPPKKRECRMQTNSLLIPPNLTTMLIADAHHMEKLVEVKSTENFTIFFRLSLCAEVQDA